MRVEFSSRTIINAVLAYGLGILGGFIAFSFGFGWLLTALVTIFLSQLIRFN